MIMVGLLDDDADDDDFSSRLKSKLGFGQTTSDQIMIQFWVMTISFSMIRASYGSMCSYISTVFSVSIASYGSGTTYL
jgi:hypothetical protein